MVGTRRGPPLVSAELLGYREGPATYAIDGNDPEAGTGFSETAYLEEGVVDAIGQRP